jgi:hypothetical protein
MAGYVLCVIGWALAPLDERKLGFKQSSVAPDIEIFSQMHPRSIEGSRAGVQSPHPFFFSSTEGLVLCD